MTLKEFDAKIEAVTSIVKGPMKGAVYVSDFPYGREIKFLLPRRADIGRDGLLPDLLDLYGLFQWGQCHWVSEKDNVTPPKPEPQPDPERLLEDSLSSLDLAKAAFLGAIGNFISKPDYNRYTILTACAATLMQRDEIHVQAQKALLEAKGATP